MAKYEIEGLKRLEKALKLLGNKASKKVLKGALRDASKPIVKNLRKRIPKRSGELRKSVGVHVDRYGNLQIGYRSSKRYRGFVGRFLEEGTKSHSIGVSKFRKKRGGKAISTPYGFKNSVIVRGIKATPMLAPAMELKHKESIEVFKKRLNERVILETINQSKGFK